MTALTATFDDSEARVTLTASDLPDGATARILRHDGASTKQTLVRGSEMTGAASFVAYDYEFTPGADETYELELS